MARAEVIIYHNPRCSKSRQTLELLQQADVDLKVVEYLQEPPGVEELEHILGLLKLEPRELMRRGEPEYRELGLDDPALSREHLLAAMAAHPRLIERPIVVRGTRATLGRPPQRVLEILP